MDCVKEGDTVKVHYTGTLEDGKTFDTSVDREPLEITLGEGQLIVGFEEALVGMQTGEKKTVVIPPEKAYGKWHDYLIIDVERERFPTEMTFTVGQQLVVSQQTDNTEPDFPPTMVTIVRFDDEKVVLDANHPLAGKELTFAIELLEIG